MRSPSWRAADRIPSPRSCSVLMSATAGRSARCIMSRKFSSTTTAEPSACACATAGNGMPGLAVVSNADPYATLVDMVGEDYLPRTFFERVKDIQVDEFSYFQVHLALKAPVRYALHEANDPAVGQAMNVNIGPEKPADLEAMWQEIRAGEFPDPRLSACYLSDRLRPVAGARRQACGVGVFAGAVSIERQTAGGLGQAQGWFLDRRAENLAALCDQLDRREHHDESRHGALSTCPGRWPNMRRGSVWVARKIPTQMGEMRPIEQISDYRTPIRRAVSSRRGDASGRRGDRGVGL